MIRNWTLKQLLLLYTIIITAFFFIGSRLQYENGNNRHAYPVRQEATIISHSRGADSSSSYPSHVVKEFVEANISINCPIGRKCIGLATGYFGSVQTWIPYIKDWMNQHHCSSDCPIIANVTNAHAVIFAGRDLPSFQDLHSNVNRQVSQLYIYFNWESPIATMTNGYNVAKDLSYRHFFNWTATYETEADVYIPYSWIRKKAKAENAETSFYDPQEKKHSVYAVISNCNTDNNRMDVIEKLSKQIDIHVYGKCGSHTFDKSMSFKFLSKKYRFYLSFENAYCKDYITEKFYLNGLDTSAVPVVFGGLSKKDYENNSPPKSFIYFRDFPSIEALAKHLKRVSSNETEYASYLAWKKDFEVNPKDKGFDIYCQICGKLNKTSPSYKSVRDLSDYYDSSQRCVQ